MNTVAIISLVAVRHFSQRPYTVAILLVDLTMMNLVIALGFYWDSRKAKKVQTSL
jgi:hypothetical protein